MITRERKKMLAGKLDNQGKIRDVLQREFVENENKQRAIEIEEAKLAEKKRKEWEAAMLEKLKQEKTKIAGATLK